ncbi:hypothetical protein AB1Y20_022298 [Prymnesium parvum]|uniref:Haem-binding uptake Tiki superfamily ChaN domain-containing protein n=1 Tax=Prymnesium parvum TaxID=97485 RepID=A0AB34JGH4_PRYPA
MLAWVLAVPSLIHVPLEQPPPSRRTLLHSVGMAGTVSSLLAPLLPPPPAHASAAPLSEAYAVRSDSSPRLSPSVARVSPAQLSRELSSRAKRAVFLGEHHDAAADHSLQAALIRQLRAARPEMAVGLEAVQQRFQPALDDYLAGRLDELELEAATEWRRRWVWPFANYAPIFQVCRELRIPLLALNVDSEDLSAVEVGGLPALPPATLRRYIPDTDGFGAFATTTAFKEYVAYVVKPSYTMHQRMGILRTTITGQQLDQDMPFRNFFSGRILWDEAMGSAAAAWCKEHPAGLLVGLVGSDHVKFGCGVPARCARQLGALDAVASVMLNPRPSDTFSDPSTSTLSDGTVMSRRYTRDSNGGINFANYVLQLRFAPVAGDEGPPIIGSAPEDRARAASVMQTTAGSAVLPLADYLMFSTPAKTAMPSSPTAAT